MESEEDMDLATLLAYGVGSFPISYLGYDLIFGVHLWRDWEKIVQKFDSRLTGLKVRLVLWWPIGSM